ncbi:hypothetical protein QVD17_16856 [Tagetes erecta]|uniref:FAR1 domain-containing protein n=1 Tax=Tagetes erecta TaxID=13708 RepID=A0AAD8P0Y1_TARER|nr:hypothetical protein QVD17_16856 [Tagetes erecta]
MAHTYGNDRLVFTGFDSPTNVPRGIEKSSPDASNKYYILDVLEDLKPKVGMTFDNMDHAFAHYCKYDVASGFSVRKEENAKQKVVRANYSKRTGCEAHIRVELVQDKWKRTV